MFVQYTKATGIPCPEMYKRKWYSKLKIDEIAIEYLYPSLAWASTNKKNKDESSYPTSHAPQYEETRWFVSILKYVITECLKWHKMSDVICWCFQNWRSHRQNIDTILVLVFLFYLIRYKHYILCNAAIHISSRGFYIINFVRTPKRKLHISQHE